MLNSDFVMQSAANLADRVLKNSNDDDRRLLLLYVTVYGREPSTEELQGDVAFLRDVTQVQNDEHDTDKRRRHAWVALCHTALAANEFLYVK